MRRRDLLASLALPAFAEPHKEKRLIVHADDAGMCHSVNLATIEALTTGSVSSASVMMPCAWSSEFAAWAKAHPEKCVGIHCTLTSEWKYYRWRPVADPAKVKGLLDPDHYVWRDVRSSATHASAAEVETELRAQIERAKEYGIQITHLDTHMGTVFARPDYFDVYAKLGVEYGVPCMIPRPTPEAAAELKEYPIKPEMLLQKETLGLPLIDRLYTGVPGKTKDERFDSYRKLIASVQPGKTTYLIIHLAKDDSEIRGVTGNWEYRWQDFQFWTSSEAKDLLGKHGVKLVTYRELAAK